MDGDAEVQEMVQPRAGQAVADVPARHEDSGYGAVIEHSLDFVSICDHRGRVLFSNAAQLRYLGYEADEVIGGTAIGLLHPDDLERVTAAFSQQLLVTGQPEPVEHRV